MYYCATLSCRLRGREDSVGLFFLFLFSFIKDEGGVVFKSRKARGKIIIQRKKKYLKRREKKIKKKCKKTFPRLLRSRKVEAFSMESLRRSCVRNDFYIIPSTFRIIICTVHVSYTNTHTHTYTHKIRRKKNERKENTVDIHRCTV